MRRDYNLCVSPTERRKAERDFARVMAEAIFNAEFLPQVSVSAACSSNTPVPNYSPGYLRIDRAIFNDPATIVYWRDGTKTIVKCQPGDTFSKETGLALAFMKRALGNKGNYNDVFRKWVHDDEKH